VVAVWKATRDLGGTASMFTVTFSQILALPNDRYQKTPNEQGVVDEALSSHENSS